MKRNWSRSKADSRRGRWAALYVTMNPQGHIFITKYTFERLGEPAAVELLYDKANASIGMAPSSAETENPYPALKRSGHGGRVIRAYSFMQEFGITLPETVRFMCAEIDEDEGILILDLRKVRSAAKPKKPKAH